MQAKVLQVQRDHIVLDRQWQGSTDLPFEFITIATGTRLTPPGNVPNAGEASKPEGIAYFQQLQGKVAAANSIVIIGGGAVGVQMATDIKELFPTKKVTVVQSRDQLMPRFDRRFHDILLSRFEELGIDLVANNRVVIPPQGFPETGEIFSVDLNDGRKLETQLVIQATGQKPNNELVSSTELTL